MLILFMGPLHSIPCLSHQSGKMKIKISMGFPRWKHPGSLTLGSWAYPKFPFFDDHSSIDSVIAWSIHPWTNVAGCKGHGWISSLSAPVHPVLVVALRGALHNASMLEQQLKIRKMKKLNGFNAILGGAVPVGSGYTTPVLRVISLLTVESNTNENDSNCTPK